MTRAVISRTALHCIWRWLNFLSVSACPVLLFIGDWNAGRADPAWVRWEVTQCHNNVAPGSPAHPDQPSPISVNNFPSPPTTSHHYNEISGLISIYGSTAARMRTGNPHRQSNRITAEFTQFWNLQSFLAEKKNTKPQLSTWIRQATTFLEPGMRNVELNHLWNVKELAKLICNWDKWRVLIFLLPASPQPAQLSPRSCSSWGCVSCLTYLLLISHIYHRFCLSSTNLSGPAGELWPGLPSTALSDHAMMLSLPASQPARWPDFINHQICLAWWVSQVVAVRSRNQPRQKTSRYLSQARGLLGKNSRRRTYLYHPQHNT